MTTYYLTPISSIFQFFTDQGVVLSGGQIFTYLGGTTTPQATQTDITGAVNNANPIVLNSAGRLPNVQVWQAGGVALKIIVKDANNNQIGPVFDQISGINDPTGLLAPFSNPASGSGADLIANAMRSYDVFASVRAAVTPSFQAGQTLIIDVQGGTAVNDGVGGFFYWNASSTASDDGQNVIKLSGAATGRFIRLGYIVPDGMVSYDVFASVRAAVTPVMASGQTLIIQTEGADSVGDNLGGHFYWSATSSASDDNANVIKPTAVSGSGRYLRIFEPIAPAQITLSAVTQFFAQTLSAEGYTTFPNGLVLQWGYATGPGTSPALVAVTFPIAFPNAFLAAVCSTNRSTDGAKGANMIASTPAPSTTGMSCVFDALDGQDNITNGGFWVAIGH